MVGSYTSKRPISIIIGSYSLTTPKILVGWVLLLHETHFSKSWVKLTHEAHFNKYWVLLLHDAHFSKSFGFYNFFQLWKNCPSVWYHHKFFQLLGDGKILPSMEYRNKFFHLLEDGKILPQYGIILISTSFQTLHAHTFRFGPKWLIKSRPGFSSQFFSLLKNLP